MSSGKVKNFANQLRVGYGLNYYKEARKYQNCAKFDPAPKVKQLEKAGIVQVPDFPQVLIDLMSTVNQLHSKNLIINNEVDPAPGVSNRLIVSLRNEMLQKYLSNIVAPYFQGYLGKQYVIRGNPRVVYNKATNVQPADRFHIDFGLHQLTLQVLLNDVDDSMTHMEYLEETNFSSWFTPRASLFTSRKPEEFLPYKKRTKIIGDAGTAFLFDAGNGYHRAKVSSVEGEGRKLFSINFTAGTHLGLPVDYYESLTGKMAPNLKHGEIFDSVLT